MRINLETILTCSILFIILRTSLGTLVYPSLGFVGGLLGVAAGIYFLKINNLVESISIGIISGFLGGVITGIVWSLLFIAFTSSFVAVNPLTIFTAVGFDTLISLILGLIGAIIGYTVNTRNSTIKGKKQKSK